MRRRGRGMGKLKGIRRVRQDGKVYRYHRATAIRHPDDIPEDHPDFVRAWLAAEDSATPAPKKEGPALLMERSPTLGGNSPAAKATQRWHPATAPSCSATGPRMVNAGWLCFDQQKTGGRVEIPLHVPLPAFADHEAQSA